MLNFQIKTLKNGVRLITCPLESTEATTLQILVGTGGRFDPLNQSGISHFLEHMFFKGSQNYPSFTEVMGVFDSIGAGFNASTSYEAIRFYIQTAAEDFKKGYDVLQDIFKNATFNEDYMELERGVILEELKMYRDMPQAWVSILNQQQSFPNHPLGADLIGTEETVSKITRDELVRNWKAHYSPQQMIIALVGNLKDCSLVETIEKDFENIPQIASKKFVSFDHNNFKPSVRQEVRKIDQANFVVSFPSIKKPDERRFALSVMDVIFGASPSSRLYTEIREKRGLAYDVGSGSSLYFDTGTYSIYGGVKADQMVSVYKLIQSEIAKLKKDGITDAELERAKGNLRGNITRSLESSFALAEYLSSSLYYHKKILSPHEILDKYDAVTKEDVVSLANEILNPDQEIITIIGPGKYRIG
jgi:predicted Zn-dependent peptidase